MTKGKGTCTWLAGQRGKGANTKSNNQRHIWQAVPTPQRSLYCLYPHPLQVGKERGALCPQSHAPSVLRPPLQASLQLWGAS